jgi:acyl-[acyl-carrier-protein]-phospholipid O-acyltransferase/long-chain-fatty-acid--[acyl-carrier-protein] ligase
MPLFATMFLGAFNDNVFRTALVTYVTFRATDLSDSTKALMVSLAIGLFMLPYFLFSATAGQLTDKYHKHILIRWIKISEIVIMGAAAIGFLTGHVLALIGLLFLMGTHSTFFGPAKYSIMPDHLKEKELLGGNGLMEAGTFLAILLGTLVGGILMTSAKYGITMTAVLVVATAVVGYITSLMIPSAPRAAPKLIVNYNFFTSTWDLLQQARKDPRLLRVILLISWFWLIGASFLAQIPNLADRVFGLDEAGLTLLMILFSLGVGVGSICTNAILKNKITLRLVPWSAAALTLFVIHFSLVDAHPVPGTKLPLWDFVSSWQGIRICIDLFLVSIAGGIYIVPLYTLLQADADPQRRSQIIATNNIMNALFMVISSGAAVLLLSMGLSILKFFLVLAVINGIVALYLVRIRHRL